MPCHWKGWATMAAIIIPTVVLILSAKVVLDKLGYDRAADLSFIAFFLPGWVFLLSIAKRHS